MIFAGEGFVKVYIKGSLMRPMLLYIQMDIEFPYSSILMIKKFSTFFPRRAHVIIQNRNIIHFPGAVIKLVFENVLKFH